jgi:Calx-beta domain-containing protein
MAPRPQGNGPGNRRWLPVVGIVAAVLALGSLGFAGSVAFGSYQAATATTTTDTTATDTSATDTTATTTQATTTESTPTTTTSQTTATTQTTTTTTASAPSNPQISADQQDYAPGSLVTLTGTGWNDGEAVNVFVNDDLGKTWSYSNNVTADSNGDFTVLVTLPTTFVANYSVVATGAFGETATTSFTDSTLNSVVPPASANEANGVSHVVNFTVHMTGSSTGSPVFWRTNGGTATGGASCGPGVDYVSVTGSNASVSNSDFNVPVTICEDTTAETNETITLEASNVNTFASPKTGTTTILNDDSSASIASPAAQAEGDSGTSNMTFTVTLNQAVPTGGTIQVDYATAADLTATGGNNCNSGNDFINASGTLTFTAGQTQQQFNVSICGDTTVEANETFHVNITANNSSPSNTNVVIGTAQATGTINNDDKLTPTVTTEIHDGSHNVVTSVSVGTTVHDRVAVSGSGGTPTGNVTVDYFTNGNCTTPADSNSGSVVLSSGAIDVTAFTKTPPLPGAPAVSFRAHYLGDANYAAADGPCEALTVTALPTSVTENLSKTSMIYGETSNISGTSTGTSTGSNIDVKTYVNAACGGSSSAIPGSPSATVAGGNWGTIPFQPSGASAPGTYHLGASFAGDSTHAASAIDCHDLTVSKAPSFVVEDAVVTSPIVLGGSAFAEYKVGSGYGISGDTATGAVTVVQDSGPAGQLGCTGGTVNINTAESNSAVAGASAAGFGFDADSGSNSGSRFTCNPTAVGTYTFHVNYAGNSNYLADDGQTLTLVVNPATVDSTVTTEVRNAADDSPGTSFNLGTSVYDHASVSTPSDATAIPAGSYFTFQLWEGNSCSGTQIGSDANSANFSGSSPQAKDSADTAALEAGDYSFKVFFHSGNTGLVKDGAAGCEAFTVNKADLSDFTTQFENGSNTPITGPFALGTSLHDAATVTGVGGIVPTGTVSFTFYGDNSLGNTSNGTCVASGTNPSNSAGSHAVDGSGVADGSTATGALHAGSYAFSASYPGDDNYNSAVSTDFTGGCESLTVNKADPSSFATAFHNASDGVITGPFALGTSLHDSATLGGAGGFTPTGTVTFTFYGSNALGNTSDGTCVVSGTNPSNSAGSHALAAGVADGSSSVGPLHAGTYAFSASYGGDGDFNAKDSTDFTGGCESLTVNKADPSSFATAFHNASDGVITGPFALGTSLHDSATLGGAGGFTPSGTVTFTFYGSNTLGNTSDGTCVVSGTNPSNSAGSHALAAGVADGSNATGALHAGTYAFSASYGGDGDFNAKDSTDYTNGCESLTVNKADTTTTTHVHNSSHTDITNTAVVVGTVVHDNSSVTTTNTSGFSITGNVIYKRYTTAGCTGSSTDQTVSVTTESSTFTPAVGSYCYTAVYGGNGDYNASPTSAIEPFSVIYGVCYLYDNTKSFKAGSTIAVKFFLCDINGNDVSGSGVVVQATQLKKMDSVASATPEDSGYANSPDNNFRYDSTLGPSGGYIFNLSTKSPSPAMGAGTSALSSGTWKLIFKVGGVSDPSYYVTFDIK